MLAAVKAQGLGAVGPRVGQAVLPTQSHPFHINNVFSPSQAIRRGLKPLLIPPQCQV